MPTITNVEEDRKDQKIKGEYQGHPVILWERAGYVFWNKVQMSIYSFDELECLSMIDYYHLRKLLTDDEKEIFIQSVRDNVNPFANKELMSNMIEKAKARGYQLSHQIIPETLAYATWPDHKKKKITLEQLQDLFDNFLKKQ